MSSPPAGPVKRLGPKFAVINDVDREIEEELDLAGSEHPKHVDDEIDELLSDNDNDDDMDGGGRSGSGMKAVGGATKQHHDGFPEWTCRWDDCFRDLVGQEALVEHVQNGKLVCPGRGKRELELTRGLKIILDKEEIHTYVIGKHVSEKDKSKHQDIHSSPTVEHIQGNVRIRAKSLVSSISPNSLPSIQIHQDISLTIGHRMP